MLCPKCGATMEETDAFCSNCGSMSMTVENSTREEPTRHPPEQIYPEKPAQPEPEPVAQKSSGKLKILTIILAITTVLSLAFAAYIFYACSITANRLERAKADEDYARNAIAQLEGQLDAMNESVIAYRKENDLLSDEIDSLSGQINTMEGEVSQSQYDKATAEQALSKATASLEALSENISELQLALDKTKALLIDTSSERQALSGELSALREKMTALEQEIAFYDAYVVFVVLEDTDKLYHNYACDHFQPQGFVAYSVKLAQANGYSPCPDCCG